MANTRDLPSSDLIVMREEISPEGLVDLGRDGPLGAGAGRNPEPGADAWVPLVPRSGLVARAGRPYSIRSGEETA